MKALVFGADNSLSTIGSVEQQAQVFGIPPIPLGLSGLDKVQGVLAHILEKKFTLHSHPLLQGATVREDYFVPNELCRKENIGVLVIDGFSHLFRNDLRSLEQTEQDDPLNPGQKIVVQRKLERDDWGLMERRYGRFIPRWISIHLPTIITMHIELDKDDEGKMFYFPAVKGGTKQYLNEYFDCVFFTRVTGVGKQRTYQWLTKPDQRRLAKDRMNLLPETIPQDFGVVFEAYRAAGYPYPRIMILGESGTGKSHALRTLHDIM